MKKNNSKRIILILLVVLLLALAVGYAAFTDTLTITGTANVNGTFDVQFVGANCSVTVQQGCTATVGVGNEDSGTNITNDKLTVTVTDLAYPGAGASIHAQIKNMGSIPVRILSISPSPAPSGNGNAIVVSGLEQIATNHPALAQNGTCDFDFIIKWDETKEVLNASNDGENLADPTNKYTFTFVITYEQNTSAITATPAHTDAGTVTPAP